MAHDTNYSRIYKAANDGLSIEEIRNALGETSLDLGTLCTSDYINRWARYRFMPDYGDVDTILQDLSVVGDGEHGMEIELHTDYSVFNTPYAYPYAAWESFRGIKPNTFGWYRLLDFDGYCRNAPNPFQSLNVPVTHELGAADTEAEAGKMRISISIDVYGQLNEGSTLLKDFSIFSSRSYYLGFIFHTLSSGTPPSPENIRVITSSTPIQLDQSGSLPLLLYVDVPDSFLFQGRWQVFAVLFNRSYPNGYAQSFPSGGAFYTLPVGYKYVDIVPASAYEIAVHSASVVYGTNNVTLTMGFSATMYNYDQYSGTESYQIYGVRDDGTVDTLASSTEDSSWPLIVYDGSGNAIRTFSNISVANQYRVQSLSTAEYYYKQYSSIQIAYNRGSYHGYLTINRDE